MADELKNEYPWMDLKEEMSESIALELIGSNENLAWCQVSRPEELVDWYNREVRRLAGDGRAESGSDDAYGDLCRLIGFFGKEDAFGDGDFWVVSDSFSTTSPSIVWFNDFPLPVGLQPALAQWKQHHPSIVKVAISDEEGKVLLTV